MPALWPIGGGSCLTFLVSTAELWNRSKRRPSRRVLPSRDIHHAKLNIAGAILEASLRGQIAATDELITINTDLLKTLREQYHRGMPASST